MSALKKMSAKDYIEHRRKTLVLVKFTPEQIKMRLDDASRKYQKLHKEAIEIYTHAALGDELNDCTAALGEMSMVYRMHQRGFQATEHDMVRAVERLKAEADDFLHNFLCKTSPIIETPQQCLPHDVSDTRTVPLFA